jgi:hypothetical protein
VTIAPTAWNDTTVGTEFEVQLGKMLDAAKNAGSPKPYLGNRAIQWGRIDLTAAGVVPLTRRDMERFRLRKGDLLVCEGGEVGRAAIWEYDIECYYQKALHRLRTRRGYSPHILLALLELRARSDGFSDYATQTSIAHLPRDKFIELPIPAIPSAEQERIASALLDADGLIAAIERAIAKKREHPHEESIHVACWLSLFTLHAIWPFVYSWAVSHKKTDESQLGKVKSAEEALAVRLANLEHRLQIVGILEVAPTESQPAPEANHG